MNKLFIATLLWILMSCSGGEPKFIRKEIDNKDVEIKWFYYSYITDGSPDFVVVRKGGLEKEIYQAKGDIVDVTLKNRNIILKIVTPPAGIIVTKKVEKEVFGYTIVIDSSGTNDGVFKVPDGVKEDN